MEGANGTIEIARRYLGKQVHVQIDRPKGSRHPDHGFEYPVNYGYVPGVYAADGEELDAYVLSVSVPLTAFTGRCVAVVHRRDDDDDKLVLIPEGMDCSDQEIRALTNFQERYFDSEIVRS